MLAIITFIFIEFVIAFNLILTTIKLSSLIIYAIINSIVVIDYMEQIFKMIIDEFIMDFEVYITNK